MEKYEKIRVLGGGNSSLAWLIKRIADDELFVLKEIDLNLLEDDKENSALNEVEFLSKLSHPNIIQMHEYFKFENKICIVIDYCEGGDMSTLIKGVKDHFSENQILDWFLQICLAVKHLHEQNILHRDLKSENVFLTQQRRVIKLGDFGIAKKLNCSDAFTSTSIGSYIFFLLQICVSSLLFITRNM
jgi:NIMA (never in mitosis gene a)-related kinase